MTHCAFIGANRRQSLLSRSLRLERKPRTASHVPMVQAEIERLIAVGELVPGERINESALALRLGVSRGPIREAARLLERDGLLRTVLNRGVFVTELSIKEVLDIYDLRATLFAMAARHAVGHITGAALAGLQELVDRMDQAVEADAIDDFYPLNGAFHDQLVDSCGNAKAAELWSQLERQLHLFRRRGLVQPGAMRASNGEHRLLVQALRLGDAQEASRIAEAHILAGKNRLLGSIV